MEYPNNFRPSGFNSSLTLCVSAVSEEFKVLTTFGSSVPINNSNALSASPDILAVSSRGSDATFTVGGVDSNVDGVDPTAEGVDRNVIATPGDISSSGWDPTADELGSTMDDPPIRTFTIGVVTIDGVEDKGVYKNGIDTAGSSTGVGVMGKRT